MSDLWVRLAEQAPYLVIIVLMFFFFLNYLDKQQQRVAVNAKELEEQRQQHENEIEEKRQNHNREINAMWASSVRLVTDQQKIMQDAFVSALRDHEAASKERYEKMGITKDLLNAATSRERERRRP